MHGMQARMTGVLSDLHRMNSGVSLDSITSFTESIGTKNAYRELCNSLYQNGVGADALYGNEIFDILEPQKPGTSGQIDGITTEDQRHFPEVGGYAGSGACASPVSTIRDIPTECKPNWNWPRLGWVRRPLDFLFGPLMPAAVKEGNTKRLTSATPFHIAVQDGYTGVVELILEKGVPIEATSKDNTPVAPCSIQ